jgi:hypothetical protein
LKIVGLLEALSDGVVVPWEQGDGAAALVVMIKHKRPEGVKKEYIHRTTAHAGSRSIE